jgi:hypothetical protein
MNPRFQVRHDGMQAFAQDAVNPPANAGTIEIGDTVILYLQGDEDRRDDVRVCVSEFGCDDDVVGTISRSNPMGATRDSSLAEGASLSFKRQQVFRFQKAT